MFEPAACLSHPGLLPDRRQTGPDRWPGSVTGSPQRAPPVSTHFLLSAPLPEPHRSKPPARSTLLPAGATSCQTWGFFFFSQPSCLKGGFSPCCLPLFLMYAFVLKVNVKLWKNRLWKEIFHGVRIKGAFTCSRAARKCFPPSESC